MSFLKFLFLAGSPVWGELVLALLILVALGTSVHLYRSQEARERVCRWAQEMRARSVFWLFRKSSLLCIGARRPGSESATGPRRCEPGQSTTVSKVVFFHFFPWSTATQVFESILFAIVLFFREFPFFSDHLLTHIAHNLMAIFPPTLIWWYKENRAIICFFPRWQRHLVTKTCNFSGCRWCWAGGDGRTRLSSSLGWTPTWSRCQMRTTLPNCTDVIMRDIHSFLLSGILLSIIEIFSVGSKSSGRFGTW